MEPPKTPNLRSVPGSALDELGLGFWSWRISPAKVRYGAVLGRFFNVPPELGERGLPLDCFTSAVHPSDQDRFVNSIRSAQMTGGGAFSASYRTLPRKGEIHHLLDRGEFEIGPEGNVIAARGIVLDVTRCVEFAQFAGSSEWEHLSQPEQAAEHAMALFKSLDVLSGASGAVAKAAVAEVLKILGREIADSPGGSVGPGSGDRLN